MRKISVFGFACAVLALIMLGGCSVFTPPAAKPIIEDHAQKQINTFAVMPSRRMVIVKSNVNQQGDLAPPSALTKDGLLKDKAVVLCAEASPDVSDDIAASLAAAASGKGPSAGEAKAAEAGISFAQALATTGQSLFKRTQALQLYRDTAYHLCQAQINGFIKDEEFLLRLVEAEKTAKELLKIEIPWLYLSQILNESQKEAIKSAVQQSITVADGKITIDNGKDKVVVAIPDAASAPTP
jgi:hypothetical protein